MKRVFSVVRLACCHRSGVDQDAPIYKRLQDSMRNFIDLEARRQD